jgi:glycosyltransferase involved in cell wall biosynthesis
MAEPLSPAPPPPLGVVIPAYGHPRFLGEAIVSACTQETMRDVFVVVVDDGCRFEETANLVRNLALRFEGKLFYLRQKNTRLPGARNTGVRFLLDAFPDLDAIFFLDADNRLSPYSLEAYRAALGDDERIGWAYPDISFFGLSWGRSGFDTRETAPDYSVLKHLAGNISEAGSLVRTTMFHHGVFYDETMRSGFEDWDFWLTALEAGYRGTRVKDAGFLYRRRAESMLADSRREEEFLVARMRRKHKALFAPDMLMRILHEEDPSFAVMIADEDMVLLFADPLAEPHIETVAAFAERVRRCRISPKEHFLPRKIAMCAGATWAFLREQGAPYMRWMFWHLLRAQGEARAVTVHRGVNVEWLGTPPCAEAHMIVLDDILVERLVWDRQGSHHVDVGTLPHSVIGLPVADLPPTIELSPDQVLAGVVDRLPSSEGRLRHADRRYAGPDARRLYAETVVPECAADEDYFPPMPWVKAADERWCAFVVVERVVQHDWLKARMQQVRSAGFKVLLILERYEGVSPVNGIAELLAAADTVVPVVFEHADGAGRFYLGRSVEAVMTSYRQLEIETIAFHFDMLVASHNSICLEAFGAVRHQRAKAYLTMSRATVDRMDVADFGRILAYEHAIDYVLTDDVAPVRAVLGSQGMPSEKIIEADSFFDALKPAVGAPAAPVLAKLLNWQPHEGYVFIVTYGRSGSTLVQTVLQAVPGYFVRGENENTLFTIFETWRRARSIRQRFDTRRQVPQHGPWYGADEVDADALAARMVEAFITEVIRPPENARVVGFKEIRYGDLSRDDLADYLEFMRHFFPRARFVFNMRNWRDVAKSSWWQDMREGFVEDMVTRCDSAFRAFAAQHPDISHLMQYEDYASDAAPFQQLLSFLGETMDAERLTSLLSQKLEH